MSLKSQLLPDIDGPDDARRATRNGARAGYGMAALTLVGMAFTYSTGTHLTQEAVESMTGAIVGIAAEGLLFAVLAYRLQAKNGWLAGTILVAVALVELAMKIAAGATNVGWTIFHLALVAYVVNGVRGALYLRKVEPAAQPAP